MKIINNQKTENKNLFDKIIKEINNKNKNKVECCVCIEFCEPVKFHTFPKGRLIFLGTYKQIKIKMI